MLKVENLSKKYKNSDIYSLNDASFEIKKGEIVGLIGKNGAGKTTMMKMIVKSLRPTSGNIIFKDKDIFSESNQLQDVGILIDPIFYPKLSVVDNLKFYLAVNKLEQYSGNIQKVLELVDLWDKKDKKPGSFSFGMKQRVCLAMCLVAEPSFAIMDEPFVGLDPIGVADLIKVLKEWAKEREMTLLISSHQLAELEELCDRFIYLEKGKLIDSFDKNTKNSNTIIIKVNNDLDLSVVNKKFAFLEINDTSISISGDDEHLNEVLAHLASQNAIENLSFNHDNQLNNYFTEG